MTASSPFDYFISFVTIGIAGGVIVMALRMQWSDLRSSLSTAKDIHTVLGEVLDRLEAIDETLDRIRQKGDGCERIGSERE